MKDVIESMEKGSEMKETGNVGRWGPSTNRNIWYLKYSAWSIELVQLVKMQLLTAVEAVLESNALTYIEMLTVNTGRQDRTGVQLFQTLNKMEET